MDLPLFAQVEDLVRALTPEELGELRTRAHRRGVKVWFGSDRPASTHYEAQLLARRHVDGTDGTALEIGFHSEHRDPARNDAALDRLLAHEERWRKALGVEAEAGAFFGAAGWRRLSEAWVEPDLEEPDLAFEVASRLVDYVAAIEPIRALDADSEDDPTR